MKRSAYEKARQEKLLSHAESLKKRELFLNVAYQTACLDELYKELNLEPENNRLSTGSSSSVKSAAGDMERKLQKKLRELKAALRKQMVGPLHPLETHTVLVFFDSDKRPFFEVKARVKEYPDGFPILLDKDPNSLYVAISEKIYEKIQLAIEEEGEEEGTNRTGERAVAGTVSSSSKQQLHGVSIKQEEEEEEEIEMEINLADDDKAEDEEEHPTVAFERQVEGESARRPTPESNSFNPPASSASSVSSGVIPPQRAMENSSSNNNNQLSISASSASAAVQPVRTIPSAELAGAVVRVIRNAGAASLNPRTSQASSAVPQPKINLALPSTTASAALVPSTSCNSAAAKFKCLVCTKVYKTKQRFIDHMWGEHQVFPHQLTFLFE